MEAYIKISERCVAKNFDSIDVYTRQIERLQPILSNILTVKALDLGFKFRILKTNWNVNGWRKSSLILKLPVKSLKCYWSSLMWVAEKWTWCGFSSSGYFIDYDYFSTRCMCALYIKTRFSIWNETKLKKSQRRSHIKWGRLTEFIDPNISLIETTVK